MEVRDLRQVRSLPWWGIQSIRTIFFFSYMFTCKVGYPTKVGQPVWVTCLNGVSLHQVKAAEWGSPPNWGNQITVPKPDRTHGRTTWLPTATNLASYFDNFIAKTRMKLAAVLGTILVWN